MGGISVGISKAGVGVSAVSVPVLVSPSGFTSMLIKGVARMFVSSASGVGVP